MSFCKKKTITLLLSLCFLFLTNTYSNAANLIMDLYMDGKLIKYEAPEVSMQIDGKDLVTKIMPPIILNERTLVPAREVFEQMGYVVTWIQETKEVTVEGNNKFITLKINSNVASSNDNGEEKNITLDVPAKIINDKTMIPIRAVAEFMSCEVNWIQDTRLIDIKTNNEENISDEKIPEEIENRNQNNDEVENENNKEEVKEETKDDNKSIVKKSSLLWEVKSKIKVDETKLNEEKNNKEAQVISYKENYKNNDYIEITINASERITNVIPSDASNRIIFDISNATFDPETLDTENVLSSNQVALNLRFGNHTNSDKSNYVRAVIDLKTTVAKYSMNYSSDRKSLIIKVYKTEINKVSYEENSDGTYGEFLIEADRPIDGNACFLSDDDRLYIDILNTLDSYGDKSEKLKNNDLVKQVRTSSHSDYTRFVLDLNKQVYFETDKVSDNIVRIKIKKLDMNLTYHNNDEYKILIPTDALKTISLNKIDITEDYMNGNYEINFNKDLSSTLGSGIYNIFDSRLNSFEVVKNKKTNNYTAIKFNTTNHRILAFDIVKQGSNYVIKVLLPGEKYDEVLYLDAGHAKGNEGTNDKDYIGPSVDKKNIYYEENITLEVVNNAYKYITDNSDIKVYLTRESNTKLNDYITNYPGSNKFINGRIGMENNIDTDMFVSIHVNAMNGKYTNYNGSEVLYNKNVNTTGTGYNGLSNKKLAEELLDGFVDLTNGNYKSDGEKLSPSYYNSSSSTIARVGVIRDGKVPGALLEMGFLDNPIDHEKLINGEYLKQASEAIAKTIINIFNKYKLNKN
ncbi:MAG: N-acetylmuramoyl-L-alanine amidase family protein [archaeon]|nr:N-acetylmuramoyl-L-alanine amidase family protein [archaeon]